MNRAVKTLFLSSLMIILGLSAATSSLNESYETEMVNPNPDPQQTAPSPFNSGCSAGYYGPNDGLAASPVQPENINQILERIHVLMHQPGNTCLGQAKQVLHPVQPENINQVLERVPVLTHLPGNMFPAQAKHSATPCPAGKYQPYTGATGLFFTHLPGNMFPAQAKQVLHPCSMPENISQVLEQSSCLNAPAGSIRAYYYGQAWATPCPAGIYLPKTGAYSCLNAPAGKYVYSDRPFKCYTLSSRKMSTKYWSDWMLLGTCREICLQRPIQAATYPVQLGTYQSQSFGGSRLRVMMRQQEHTCLA